MGYVYLLAHRDGDKFKIGKTRDPWPRFKSVGGLALFDVARSIAVEVDNYHALEADLHRRFASHRLPPIAGLNGGSECFSNAAYDAARSLAAAYPCARVYEPIEKLIGDKVQRVLARIPSPEVYERAMREDSKALTQQFAHFSIVLRKGLASGAVLGCRHTADPEEFDLFLKNNHPVTNSLFETACRVHTTDFGGMGCAWFSLISGGRRCTDNPIARQTLVFPLKIADKAVQYNPYTLEPFARLYELYAEIPGFLDNKLPAGLEGIEGLYNKRYRGDGVLVCTNFLAPPEPLKKLRAARLSPSA